MPHSSAMKSCASFISGSLLCCWSLSYVLSAPAPTHSVQVRIVPQYNAAAVEFDTLGMADAAGQKLSVTRLDFLLSGWALRRPDGKWMEQTNLVAYVSAREGRTGFRLNGIPTGHYDRVRFLVGLKPEINHRDPADYPAGHPLNPDVNGLHWGWMGGYVFLALEGNWVQPDGKVGGYSYHLATDRQLMAIELPVNLELAGEAELRVALNLDRVFGGRNPILLSGETTSTHSRTNDALADQLRANVMQAFGVGGNTPIVGGTDRSNAPTSGENQAGHTAEPLTPSLSLRTREGNGTGVARTEIGPNATPYPLSFAAYFPRPDLPRDNPLTEEGVELGRRLFFDPRLSVNNSQSCASCHRPNAAFTDGKAVAVGAEEQAGRRNSMALFNLAWKSSFFWDGRAPSLREQVLQPIQNPIEMHESLTNVVAKLNKDEEYQAQFNRAFGTPNITPDRLARALEQFLLTQVACDSKFDHVLRGEATFTVEEQRGFELFHTEYDPRHEQFGADCFHCHGGPLFQSQNFANNGLDAEFTDSGRKLVTGREGDRGRFAVPSLRNVEVTGPYMHDGRFKTLEEVVEHYCTGLKRSATLDANLAKHPDGGVPLNGADKKALVAFLRTLTDEKYKRAESELLASDNAGKR